MTAMIPQCYFCKLHEQGTKCVKYDQIAPEILVNLRKCTLKKIPARMVKQQPR